ncbi:recombinase family protein [Paracoccus sp. ME4]|uniref:recombinase family protein n=1 Tax=Paracoccus sp. ME4 TaxID=3138066 RepID=UPI00398AFB4E
MTSSSSFNSDTPIQQQLPSPTQLLSDTCAVGYIRVSTEKQTVGAGTVRQREAIEAYARAANVKIIEFFEESHSATDGTPLLERPEFAKAVEMALRCDCPIFIEKFDRLSRNPALHAEWRRTSRVRIVAVCEEDLFETPGERARIAAAGVDADAKAAGQAAAYAKMRAEGRPLGNPNPSPIAHQKSAEIRRHFARVRHLKIVDVLDELGHDLPRPDLVRALNERGIRTGTGKPWTSGLLAPDYWKAIEILKARVEASEAKNDQDEADRVEMEKDPRFAMF